MHGVAMAFFASGYFDLVVAAPKSYKEIVKRVVTGIAVYLLWQPIAVFLGIETSTNVWPILLLSVL